MNELTKSVSTMMDAFTPVLQKLSETFCVSVDYIKENAMCYIMEYGRYCLAKDLVFWNILWLVIGLVITVIVLCCIVSEDNTDDSEIKSVIKYTTITTGADNRLNFNMCSILDVTRNIFHRTGYWSSKFDLN